MDRPPRGADAASRPTGSSQQREFDDVRSMKTLQITTLDAKNPAECVHDERTDGTPVCGTPLRSLRGMPAMYTSLGKGVVTCGSCARITS